jgi:hypothetical protein
MTAAAAKLMTAKEVQASVTFWALVMLRFQDWGPWQGSLEYFANESSEVCHTLQRETAKPDAGSALAARFGATGRPVAAAAGGLIPSVR